MTRSKKLLPENSYPYIFIIILYIKKICTTKLYMGSTVEHSLSTNSVQKYPVRIQRSKQYTANLFFLTEIMLKLNGIFLSIQNPYPIYIYIKKKYPQIKKKKNSSVFYLMNVYEHNLIFLKYPSIHSKGSEAPGKHTNQSSV